MGLLFLIPIHSLWDPDQVRSQQRRHTRADTSLGIKELDYNQKEPDNQHRRKRGWFLVFFNTQTSSAKEELVWDFMDFLKSSKAILDIVIGI